MTRMIQQITCDEDMIKLEREREREGGREGGRELGRANV